MILDIKYGFLAYLIFCPFIAISQANNIHSDVLRDYNQGLQFIQNEDYKQAYQFFESISEKDIPVNQITNINFYKNEARYYKAYLASKLEMPDAIIQLENLYEETHDARKNLIAFHLGNHYFDLKDFEAASNWYSNTSEEAIKDEWKDDYKFKLGYSQMKANNMTTALSSFNNILESKKSKYKSEAAYYSGVIQFNKKNYEKAERHLQSIASLKQTEGANFILAQIQFLKKNYSSVIDLLKNSSSNDKGKNQLLGKSYFETNQYSEAETFLQRHLSESNKISPEDMYQLAYSEYKNKNYLSAINHFKELQLSNGFGQYAMYALADCYLKVKDKQNALSAFQQASQLNQDETITEESAFHVAKLNYDLSNYNQATDAFFDFTKKYPNSNHSKEAWDLLTLSLLNTNNYPQVIGIIEKNPEIRRGNESLYQEICYTQAVNAYNDGDTNNAVKYLGKSLLNPVDEPLEAEAHYLKAEILTRLNDIKYALVEYNETYRLIKRNNILFAQNANLFNVHYGIGYCEYYLGNYDEALQQFLNSAKNYKYSQNEPISNTMQDADLRIADIYFMKKNYTEAYKQYSKISKRRGQGYDYATLQKANIDGVRKNFSAKINTLTRLMREVPNSVYYNDAHYQLGIAYEDNRNFEKAVNTYNNIIKTSKSQEYIPKSYMRLATIYYNNQNQNQALKNYTAIVEKYVNSPEADQALKAIREIYIGQGKPDQYITYLSKLPNSKQLALSGQDSFLFESGEELYANQKYDNALNIFSKYLNKFPNGIFNKKAHYLKAECYAEKKMYPEAIEEYKYLTVENDNPYHERALVKSAYYSYNTTKDYNNAKSFYQKLQTIASSSKNKQLAKIGLLKASYRLKNYVDVIEIAKLIEVDDGIHPEIKYEAVYFKAISLFEMQNYKSAIPVLEALSQDKNSSKGAECTYYLATSYHNLEDFKKSNEVLLQAKDDYGSYEQWVVRYFILIGYNYHKLDDNFQAKATLESIINNYTGDQELIREAREKLAEVNQSIKDKSKVKYK